MIKRDPALDAMVVRHAKQRPNCAQTSFLTMRERFGLPCDEASFVNALTALPGAADTGETCGAVSGPLLAFGLALAPKNKEQVAKCHAAGHEFCLAVQKEFGSTRCGDIIERCCGTRYDLSNPEDAKKYLEAGGMQKCLKVVQTNVHLATGILEEAIGKGGTTQAH